MYTIYSSTKTSWKVNSTIPTKFKVKAILRTITLKLMHAKPYNKPFYAPRPLDRQRKISDGPMNGFSPEN